jgi:hypothetical protein
MLSSPSWGTVLVLWPYHALQNCSDVGMAGTCSLSPISSLLTTNGVSACGQGYRHGSLIHVLISRIWSRVEQFSESVKTSITTKKNEDKIFISEVENTFATATALSGGLEAHTYWANLIGRQEVEGANSINSMLISAIDRHFPFWHATSVTLSIHTYIHSVSWHLREELLLWFWPSTPGVCHWVPSK